MRDFSSCVRQRRDRQGCSGLFSSNYMIRCRVLNRRGKYLHDGMTQVYNLKRLFMTSMKGCTLAPHRRATNPKVDLRENYSEVL